MKPQITNLLEQLPEHLLREIFAYLELTALDAIAEISPQLQSAVNDVLLKRFLRFIDENDIENTRAYISRNNVTKLLGSDDTTPLFYAALYGHVEIVKLLIEAGVDVNQPSEYGYDPLAIAAERGHAKVIDLLCQAGAELNRVMDNGWTPLTRAVAYRHREATKVLIKAGADVSVVTGDGKSLLAVAIGGKSDPKIIELLLRAGVNQTWVGFFEKTLLHWIAEKGHHELFSLISRPKQFVNAEDRLGGTPLSYAASNKHPRIAALLLAMGANMYTRKYGSGELIHEIESLLSEGKPAHDIAAREIQNKILFTIHRILKCFIYPEKLSGKNLIQIQFLLRLVDAAIVDPETYPDFNVDLLLREIEANNRIRHSVVPANQDDEEYADQQKTDDGLFEIPDDILEAAFEWLTPSELAIASQVSKRWHAIIGDHNKKLWKRQDDKFLREFIKPLKLVDGDDLSVRRSAVINLAGTYVEQGASKSLPFAFHNPYVMIRIFDILLAGEIKLHLDPFGVLKGITELGISVGALVSLIVSRIMEHRDDDILPIDVCIEIISDDKLSDESQRAITRAFAKLFFAENECLTRGETIPEHISPPAVGSASSANVRTSELVAYGANASTSTFFRRSSIETIDRDNRSLTTSEDPACCAVM